MLKVFFMGSRIFLAMSDYIPYVSASEVADASFCSYRLQNRLKGLRPSKAFIKSAKRGNKKHDYQNRVGRDRRCYIATYAYGSSHPVTNNLRDFRDKVLLSNGIGKLFVHIYYITSPHLIWVCNRFPLIDKVVKQCLNRITSFLL